MGVVQITEIESVLKRLYNDLEEKPDLCATFNIRGRDEWVQLTENMLNIHWPYGREFAMELEESLKKVLSHCRLLDLVEGTYVTYEIERVGKGEMAGLIDWVFREVYGVGEGYGMDTEIMEI